MQEFLVLPYISLYICCYVLARIRVRFTSMYFDEGSKRNFLTEVQFGEASGGHSITLRETSGIYTRILLKAFSHIRTQMRCLYVYASERGRSVLKWARGPPATRVGCIIISASLCCYAIRVR